MKQEMVPTRRDLHFALLPQRIQDWHGQGMHVSYFFNAMSLFFPDGERFFIDSVRHYRTQISDPVLKEQVRGFIGQEAMHGREHEAYNQALAQRGMPVGAYLKFINMRLNVMRRYTSARWQLAVTIALEHLTAILAGAVLRDSRLMANSEPRFAAIWRWHAMEETEHKAVAFDVYRRVAGGGVMAYLLRCLALILSSSLFMLFSSSMQIGMLRREGRLFDLRGWGRLMNYLWGRPGLLRGIVFEWLDFFRPGFHPWHHDNRNDLKTLNQLVEEISTFQ
jgi:uncharacterized protein